MKIVNDEYTHLVEHRGLMHLTHYHSIMRKKCEVIKNLLEQTTEKIRWFSFQSIANCVAKASSDTLGLQMVWCPLLS